MRSPRTCSGATPTSSSSPSPAARSSAGSCRRCTRAIACRSTIEPLEVERLQGIDAAVVAYPHAAAAPTVGALRERDIRVVDLSADFRLRSLAAYEHWYGEHPRPDLLDEAVYGLTELHRDEIAGAGIVANPGCYPTASLLALAPLARAGLIADLVIDAKQGISGAGRVFDETTHLSMAGENIVPYKVAAHRHTPEIEEQLALLATRRTWQEHRLPRRSSRSSSRRTSCRSIRARWPAATSPPRAPLPARSCERMYTDAYAAEPFVELLSDHPPGVLEVRETNYCRVFAAADGHTGKVIAFGAIDNLWKGTSSQAVQNLNLMFGFPETRGLL